jgi:iron complex transport system ATP-binding protein
MSAAKVSAMSFEGVAVRLGGQEILRDIHLEVPAGQVIVLAGCNGAGKTTLLRVASRVLRPSAGRVLLGGQGVDGFSRRELAQRLAVVQQDVLVSFPFSAGEVVLMGRAPHLGLLGFESRSDIGIAREAMERLEIEHLADRSILELSGGERQLVSIARALAQQPQVLLLDEPTSHLDLAHRVAVLDCVRDFAREGRTALVVSHDLSLAARSCDVLALLAKGEILASGPPQDVLTVENLREVFGIRADIVTAPDGWPVVVPRGVHSDERTAPP